MRYLSLYMVFLLAVWLATGCASSRPARNQKSHANQKLKFTTGIITANFGYKSGQLSEPEEIQYLVHAQCKGTNCMPDKAELSFYIQTGRNIVYMNDRDLSIHAGNKDYYWSGIEWSNIYESPPVFGLIKTVTLKQDQLTQIANSQKVTGNLAGQEFKWSYKNREPIRTLLENMKSHKTGKVK